AVFVAVTQVVWRVAWSVRSRRKPSLPRVHALFKVQITTKCLSKGFRITDSGGRFPGSQDLVRTEGDGQKVSERKGLLAVPFFMFGGQQEGANGVSFHRCFA